MPNPKRVELTVPIAEDDLVAFLLSRYPAGELERVGIYPSNSVIRDFQVAPDGKCNFRVSVITGIDVEQILEDAGQALVADTEQADVQGPPEEGASCVDCEPDVPTDSTAPACPMQQLHALRVKKPNK